MEATYKGAPREVIGLNGRWKKSIQGGASKPSVTIHEHYIDNRLVLDQQLKFSKVFLNNKIFKLPQVRKFFENVNTRKLRWGR